MKILFLLCISLAVNVMCEELMGVPNRQVYVDESKVNEKKLTESLMLENRIHIKKVNGVYYWVSRKETVLNKINSGIYDIYVSPEGAGYVKVNNQTDEYIEHVHLGLKTITYYGIIIK